MSGFIDLLQSHGVPYIEEGHHHCRPGWVQMDCPNCSPGSSRWRMGFNLGYRYLNCYLCGKRPLGDTVASLCGIPLGEALAALRNVAAGESTLAPVKRTGTFKPPKGIGPLLKAHRTYLKGRGFNPQEIADTWGAGGIGIASSLSWRIYIPAIVAGVPVSWTTRSISDTGTRYLSAPAPCEAVPIKELLYGCDLAGHSISIHEGPLDAWTVGPGAVATCGVGYSRTQLALMAGYPVRFICFDNEPDAQKRAEKLGRDLAALPGSTHNVTMSGKDANRSPKSEIRELRKMLRDGHFR